MKIKNFPIYTALIFVVSVSFWLFYAEHFHKDNIANYSVATSQNAVWNLSEYDFSSSVTFLSGDVEHISGKILTPEEFYQNENLIELSNPIDHETGRTARLKLILPKNSSLSICLSGDYARAVYLNGEFKGSVGTVSENIEGFSPGYGILTIPVTTSQSGEVELIIQGGNFVHREGSSYSNIYVSNPNLLNWYNNYDLFMEVLTGGMLFCFFLLFFALIFITKNYLINFYFSLLSLLWAVRLGVTGSKFLYTLFPNLSWNVAFRLEYITLALTIAFIIRIILLHLPNLSALQGLRFLCYPLYALSAAYLFLDSYIISYTSPILTVFFIVIIIYISIIVIVSLISNKGKNSYNLSEKIFLFALMILCICGINDALYFNNIYLLSTTMTETAVLMFAFFEAIVIFYLNMEYINKIDELKRQEEIRAMELEHYLNLKSHFLGIVAHEIKTPLSIIIGSAGDSLDIINEDIDYRDENLECIKNNQHLITQTVMNLNETVFDLLDSTALETGRLSLNLHKTSLKDLIVCVSEQYSQQMQKSGNTLKLDLENPCDLIYADSKRIKQVVLNLLSNTCKHAPNSTVCIKLWADGKSQHILISDTGNGISRDILNVINEKYSGKNLYKYSGGIGLYICSQIISSHKGELTIESEEGQGTSVSFSLPINPELLEETYNNG